MQYLTLKVIDVVVVKHNGHKDRLCIQFAGCPMSPGGSSPSIEIACQQDAGLRYAEDVLGLTDVRVVNAG